MVLQHDKAKRHQHMPCNPAPCLHFEDCTTVKVPSTALIVAAACNQIVASQTAIGRTVVLSAALLMMQHVCTSTACQHCLSWLATSADQAQSHTWCERYCLCRCQPCSAVKYAPWHSAASTISAISGADSVRCSDLVVIKGMGSSVLQEASMGSVSMLARCCCCCRRCSYCASAASKALAKCCPLLLSAACSHCPAGCMRRA